jgi:hypothetical protein
MDRLKLGNSPDTRRSMQLQRDAAEFGRTKPGFVGDHPPAATFTDHDLARFAHRHSDGKAQFDQVLNAIKASPDLALGRDGQGWAWFTSRDRRSSVTPWMRRYGS